MRLLQLGQLHSFVILCLAGFGDAVTIYYPKSQAPMTTSVSSASAATSTPVSPAYDTTVLTAPALPNPLPPMQFEIQLSSGQVPSLSIPQKGSFFGFSIEFSVINQVLGKNSSLIQVPFLNLMSNIVKRAGSVHVRVGGNTQDFATLVDKLPDGKILEKDPTGSKNPTQTPPLQFTPDVIYMMANISKLVNVRWYMGIPFMDTKNFALGIAEKGQQILGDYLIGLQGGNEPDLYLRHLHRTAPYGPFDYFGEFGNLVNAVNNDSQIKNKNMLIGPSVATGDWTPEQVWNTGFIPKYASSLSALSVEHYPTDNCNQQFNFGTPRTGQQMFPTFLNHTSGQAIVAPYLNSTAIAQAAGKPFIMFETNTASCGGFAGLSDSFGAALWGLDYAMTMAYSNFSGALFHVGGQSVYYNPFTAPPTNESSFHQWTIGPIYYSALIMSEVLGSSNQSQIVDLNANAKNIYTPAYAVYERGLPRRLALFNYLTDPSGASTYTVSISVGGGQTGQPNATPPLVRVKYFTAPSVSSKGNFSWAGQTFGDHFSSDGRPVGNDDTKTILCDTAKNVCQLSVPAPGFALVYLSDDAYAESSGNSGDSGISAQTFATTAVTKSKNTATVDMQVLATSNGHQGLSGGQGLHLASTSKGNGVGRAAMPSLLALAMSAFGGLLVLRRI